MCMGRNYSLPTNVKHNLFEVVEKLIILRYMHESVDWGNENFKDLGIMN